MSSLSIIAVKSYFGRILRLAGVEVSILQSFNLAIQVV